MKAALVLLSVAAACATDRPVHPMRLEGFPGAPIEPGLFPLRDGTRWTFADEQGKPLALAVRAKDGKLVLSGQTQGEAEIREHEGFVEILYEGRLLDRPLKLEGAAGDQWKAAGATYMVFGYEEIEVLGKKTRTLVVAADRLPVRDLYWFAKDVGWVRLRTERNGKTLRDARLVAFEAGPP
jgi:hypothetical protein